MTSRGIHKPAEQSLQGVTAIMERPSYAECWLFVEGLSSKDISGVAHDLIDIAIYKAACDGGETKRAEIAKFLSASVSVSAKRHREALQNHSASRLGYG